MIEFRKACMDDADTILKLYNDLINAIKNNVHTPEWDYGVYPKEENIINAIKSDELYVGVMGSEIVSLMVVNHTPNMGFDTVKWNVDEDYDKVYVVHLVAVKYEHNNKGIAKKMLNYLFDLAKENMIKSIRLSIIRNNKPAEHLYKKFDFKYVDSVCVHADERGLKEFKIYEKVL